MRVNEEKLLFAMDYATKLHKGQVRKYTGEPYITHPFAVAGLLTTCNVHTDVIAAGFLHDILEDCDVSVSELRGIFGWDIAMLVNAVTDISLPETGTRKVRKNIDRAHLSRAPKDAKTIKLADIIDNCKNLAEHDWEFAKVYMAEKRESLKVLKGGDENLYRVAEGILEDYFTWMEGEV